MRVTVVINSRAGDGEHDRDALLGALRKRGDQVRAVSSRSAFAERARESDLVIAAGGDGTVAKVVRALVGTSVPVHILPLGTANNIARSLGVDAVVLDLRRVVKEWRNLAADVAESGHSVLVESAGCGAVAELIRDEDGQERRGPRSEARGLAIDLEAMPSFAFQIESDRQRMDGQAILVEVMNIARVGPSLVLAPHADPTDGQLELVIAREEHRPALSRYLHAGGRGRPPQLETIRGRSFTISCRAPWHFDDAIKRPRRERTVRVRPAAWRVLVP